MSALTQPADMAPMTREAVAERLEGGRMDIANAVYKWTMLAALLVSLAVLVMLIWSVLGDGLEVLTDRGLHFLTNGNSGDSSTAGMWQAIYGSFFIALFVALVAFPLGIAAAVYIEEYASDTWFTSLISVNIRNLAGVPSIVYGLLGLSVFVEDPRGVHRRSLDHRRGPHAGHPGPAHRHHHGGRGATSGARQHP